MRCVRSEKAITTIYSLTYGRNVFSFDCCSDVYFLLTEDGKYFCFTKETLFLSEDSLADFLSNYLDRTVNVSKEPITIYPNAHLVLD